MAVVRLRFVHGGLAWVHPRCVRFSTLVLLVLAIGCSQNIDSVGKGESPPPPPRPLATQFDEPRPNESEQERLARGTPPGISGEIRVAPGFEEQIQEHAVLFVFARTPGGGPIAAKRLAHPVFPVRFFLGQESSMFEGQGLPGEVDVEVRISQSGSAGPPGPGDLTGKAKGNPLKVGDSQVHEILIDTVY